MQTIGTREVSTHTREMCSVSLASSLTCSLETFGSLIMMSHLPLLLPTKSGVPSTIGIGYGRKEEEKLTNVRKKSAAPA